MRSYLCEAVVAFKGVGQSSGVGLLSSAVSQAVYDSSHCVLDLTEVCSCPVGLAQAYVWLEWELSCVSVGIHFCLFATNNIVLRRICDQFLIEVGFDCTLLAGPVAPTASIGRDCSDRTVHFQGWCRKGAVRSISQLLNTIAILFCKHLMAVSDFHVRWDIPSRICRQKQRHVVICRPHGSAGAHVSTYAAS